MVSAELIIETAVKEKVDLIGLSGLITPSLQEMVHIAQELTRRNLNIPLLVGGATTSQKHTAVKIAPVYEGGNVIHVSDASRSVNIVSKLLSAEHKVDFLKNTDNKYRKMRRDFEQTLEKKDLNTLDQARSNKFIINWQNSEIIKPSFLGNKIFDDFPLAEIRERIDWTPFFHVWDLKGRFPDILENKKYGATACRVYEDAQKLLDKIIVEKSIQAKSVIGFYPANSIGDDIEILNSDHQHQEVFHTLRQQKQMRDQASNKALSDFIAPKDSGIQDYIGAFVVTAGHNVDELVKQFDGDDYQAIMVKALADRLAEGLAELMHEQVRKEFWGYAADENLTNVELIKERYHGIRPAPGYAACPDHTEKGMLFDLLNAGKNTGVSLTESYAMYPTASVAGFYFAHPQAQYFVVGKLDKDQIIDYAKRKGQTIKEAERWLAPYLAYK